MFSPNVLRLNFWQMKDLEQFFTVLLKSQMNLNANQINYELIKEKRILQQAS